MHPIQLFNTWFAEEQKRSKIRIPSACCLSTVGLDDYPNSRFVSLKETRNDCFIVTGSLTSRKGLEVNKSNKVSLTFWWTETERQVRVQGNATQISDELADKYFVERNRDSQIVSIVSEQGRSLQDLDALVEKYNVLEAMPVAERFTRPDNWSGFAIQAIRIEFLEFKATRFHERILFELINDAWTKRQLQP